MPIIVAIVCIFWFAICFFDFIFKSCMLPPYIHFLQRSGITVKPLYIHYQTTRLNRAFRQYTPRTKWTRRWFDAGAIITCLLYIPATCLVLSSAIALTASRDQSEATQQVLQPVIIGFNLPISQVGYYVLTIIVCSIIHELGHAFAAIRENVSVRGCGFLILLVIPASFVNVYEEQLYSSSPWQQIRILSAGIWHNIVLSAAAFGLLTMNPFLLSPMFHHNSGVSVLDVQGQSLRTAGGLIAGDRIFMVNDCPISDTHSWKSCLQEIALNPQSGFCVTNQLLMQIENYEEKGVHVNNRNCDNSSTHLKFKYLKDNVEVNKCFPVRTLLSSSNLTCRESSLCKDSICMVPILESGEKFVKISRLNSPEVLFVGFPNELFANLKLSSWIPKHNIVSAQLVHMYETFLQYIASFSSALAILNVIPCPGLDGQQLIRIFLDCTLIKFCPALRPHKGTILFVLTGCGCIMLIVNIMFGLYRFTGIK